MMVHFFMRKERNGVPGKAYILRKYVDGGDKITLILIDFYYKNY